MNHLVLDVLLGAVIGFTVALLATWQMWRDR
jgi:membrane-associated phospholipid phosphatase